MALNVDLPVYIRYAEAMHVNEGANSSNRISLAQIMSSLSRK